jgi:probable HAF family extracellular repeat protein
MVVGESALGNSDIHAFLYSAGRMADLGTFGGTYSSAFQINSNGQVIGVASTTSDAQTNGFIYTGGVLTDLGNLGGTSATPLALNNRGQVVGVITDPDGSSRAFLWETNKMVDLNSLLPSNSGWQLAFAELISDSGRIVGTGTSNGIAATFILDLAAANNPPIAVAGADQTVDCQANVTLNGSGSSDPDHDSLAFEWTASGAVLGTNSVITVSLPMGTNIVTLTVTDTCGASSKSDIKVIVADTTPHVGYCPAPITVSADANCQAHVPDFTSQVIATDNCTPTQALVIAQNPAPGTVLGLGQHPVAITVTDTSGNSSMCSVLFTVADKTPPMILSLPSSFTLSAGSGCQSSVPNILASVVASDSCTPANLLVKSQSPTPGTLAGIGPHTIQVTVSDLAGNSATGAVSFTVSDTTPPVFLSGPSPVQLSGDAHCQAAVPNLLGTVLVSDNCTPQNQIALTQSPLPGTVLPEGNYTVALTATDASGNSNVFNVSLAITDTTAPMIQALSVSPGLLSPPNHQLVPVTVSALVTDNCDPAPVTKIVSITCNEATASGDIQITGNLTAMLAASKSASGGTRIYTLNIQAKDASGNTSTGAVTVSVPKNNSNGNGNNKPGN